jgi:hypothetical protein
MHDPPACCAFTPKLEGASGSSAVADADVAASMRTAHHFLAEVLFRQDALLRELNAVTVGGK